MLTEVDFRAIMKVAAKVDTNAATSLTAGAKKADVKTVAALATKMTVFVSTAPL